MAKTLRSNVFVYEDETAGTGEWYGPAYGNADKAPTDKITNPAAWEEPVAVGSGDLRFRADDYGETVAPNLRNQAEEAARQRDEAELEGRAAVFGGTAAEEARVAREAAKQRSESSSRRQSSKS